MISHSLLESSDIEEVIWEDLENGIQHGILVSNLAALLTRELGETEEFCQKVGLAGMVHDIGKLRLSKYLYGRHKDTLRIEEMKYVRMHTAFSYNILKKEGFEEEVLNMVYHHHENYDGTGYPDNLKREEIPLGARILRVCDVFAALVSTRPYRAAFDVDTTMELMIDEVKNFDMKLFLAFQRVVYSEEFDHIKDLIERANKKRLYTITFFTNTEQRQYK